LNLNARCGKLNAEKRGKRDRRKRPDPWERSERNMTNYEEDDFSQGTGLEPTPAGLAHWIQEQYNGDDRFESIELLDPGPLEGEAVRVAFMVNDQTRFFLAVLEEDERIRIGLATANRAVSKAIEAAAMESGDSLTEFLADAIEADDELEHEVQHFHDDVYYFCSDIPFQRLEDLASPVLRDEVIYYLDGYMNALFDYIETGGGTE
jgi:hypothetical protein